MNPSLLLSYFFWSKARLEEVVDGFPERPCVFADSGGFSAASVGASIDLDEYAGWLDVNRDFIDVACTLDVIGNAEATWENTRRLEDHGHRVLPVFHTGEPWEWLERYCEEYRYVGVGGMVPYTSRPRLIRRWLVECFSIARRHDAVIHGLGMTNTTTLGQLPFYSVDSSSFVAAERFGEFYVWDPQAGKLLSIHPLRNRATMMRHGALVRAHGLDPHDMEGVPSVKDPKVIHAPTSREPGISLARAASVRAWLGMADWWARRHGPITLEGMPDGPIFFFSCLDKRVVATVKQVAREQSGVDDAATAPA